MKTHRTLLTRILIIALLLLSESVFTVASADDAAVLPKGRWRLYDETRFFLPITQRYNKNGQAEDVAAPYNANLNSNVFTSLKGFEAPPFGLPSGSASIGSSVVEMRWRITETVIQPAYGVTDSLTIGLNLPYIWQKNNVRASLNASNATICKGAPLVLGTGGLAPCGVFGATTKLTTDDVQSLLGTSFGFKHFGTWQDDGLGDIEAGGKYQYYKSDRWRLATSAGVKLPTGKIDDPDNLADRGFGTGTYALLLRLHQDYLSKPGGVVAGLGIPEANTFFINTTFRYAYYLPDKQTLRVCSVDQPICNVKDEVRRKVGDEMEAEGSLTYGLLQTVYLTGLYRFEHGFQTWYGGDKPLNYGILSDQSDFTQHLWQVSVSYTTVPLVVDGSFPFPLTASIFFRDKFAGDNDVFKSRAIGFTIAAYF